MTMVYEPEGKRAMPTTTTTPKKHIPHHMMRLELLHEFDPVKADKGGKICTSAGLLVRYIRGPNWLDDILIQIGHGVPVTRKALDNIESYICHEEAELVQLRDDRRRLTLALDAANTQRNSALHQAGLLRKQVERLTLQRDAAVIDRKMQVERIQSVLLRHKIKFPSEEDTRV